MTLKRFLGLSLVLLTVGYAAIHIFPSLKGASKEAQATEAYFNALVASSSPELITFLHDMPKGGDLHNHLSGSIYAENYINWTAKSGLCVDTDSLTLTKQCQAPRTVPLSRFIGDNKNYVHLIDAWSMRDFLQAADKENHGGAEHFFASFSKFDEGGEPAFYGKMLAEVVKRAEAQHVLYLELMVSPQMAGARALGKQWPTTLTPQSFDAFYTWMFKQHDQNLEGLVRQAKQQLDQMEKEAALLLECKDQAFAACPVQVRYQAQVIRTFSFAEVFAQTLFAYAWMKEDPRVVTVNFVGPEHHPQVLEDYNAQMQAVSYVAHKFGPSFSPSITLHAGELSFGQVPPEHLRFHIADAITVGGAKRIGHGVDIVYENHARQLLKKMAKDRIMVEINLTSNDVILGVRGDRHPFRTYKKYNVPVALSTDDEGVSRSNLTHEYYRAVTSYKLSYPELKTLSRNSVEYAFLNGESYWKSVHYKHGVGKFTVRYPACAGEGVTTAACSAAVIHSQKARVQHALELQWLGFEKQYAEEEEAPSFLEEMLADD